MVDLVRRLRVLETLRQHPEIATVPIPPIVYITGLERSGTTLLHNLLALQRDARVSRRGELLEPVPPPETATYETDDVVQHALEASAADDGLPAKVIAFLQRQQAGERAAPPAALDSMGYDREDVWSDPVISSYCERFGIDPERTRLTGAAPAS